MSVIFETGLADCSQANGAFAAGVVCEVFVGCSEVGRLAFAVVVVSGDDHLVSEVQELAPAAFEVFRGGRVWQSVRRFTDPKQIQKLAGYAIVSNDSGKHTGESHISYRGRKRLRYVMYEAAVSVVSHSPEFKSIHQYYTTRDRNPLKKMQSMIAVACKLIRVFYKIMTSGADYDGAKMIGDIRRPSAA